MKSNVENYFLLGLYRSMRGGQHGQQIFVSTSLDFFFATNARMNSKASTSLDLFFVHELD